MLSTGWMPRVVALIVAVALLAGVAALVGQLRPARAPAPPPPAAEPTFRDDVVEQALELADSTRIKWRWVEVVPGEDLDALSPVQRERFVRFANARACTCGCDYSLAGCRAYDPTCETSGPLVRALYDSVRAGLLTNVTGLRERPTAR